MRAYVTKERDGSFDYCGTAGHSVTKEYGSLRTLVRYAVPSTGRYLVEIHDPVNHYRPPVATYLVQDGHCAKA